RANEGFRPVPRLHEPLQLTSRRPRVPSCPPRFRHHLALPCLCCLDAHRTYLLLASYTISPSQIRVHAGPLALLDIVRPRPRDAPLEAPDPGPCSAAPRTHLHPEGGLRCRSRPFPDGSLRASRMVDRIAVSLPFDRAPAGHAALLNALPGGGSSCSAGA